MTAANLPALSDHDLLCRAVREFRPGEVVFAGVGDFLQEPELPAQEPERFGVWFLNPQGAVTPGLPNRGWNYQWNPVDLPPGGAYLGAVDVAAIMHRGRVDAAVLMLHHEDQLSPSGRLRYTDCEWGGLPKPEHPGYGPSLLSARRLIGCCGRVGRLICSHYSNNLSVADDDETDDPTQPTLEVVPAGILAERIRAGGAGLRGVFLPAGAGLIYADGYESREIDGRPQILYPALKADFALLRAAAADTLGSLVYRGTQRNWNPIMAMAASTVVAEVDEIVAAGELDPELIITPGIFVDRIVQRGRRESWPQ